MNTKTFAQQSRRILLKGVADKLRYWGFDEKGNVLEEPQVLSGGYMFRGEVYDDPTLVQRWLSLRAAAKSKGMEVVLEEAAYTWFNRIMAIRILAKNGYEAAQLEYAEGAQRLPLILQRARRGTHPFLTPQEASRLQKIINDFSQETEAFAILLIGYCHAHPLLHRVFGSIDDYTELLLPDNILAEEGFLHLLNTTDAISDEDYRQVELIGWLYQFYISEKKDEVFAAFKKNKKAEAKDIPAATQIFTPNWIVKYMVENTVGKIWLDLHPNSPLRQEMKYLVEPGGKSEIGSRKSEGVEGGESISRVQERGAPFQGELFPQAETENNKENAPLITEVSQLKLLDPACGSGHILVEGFELLYKMYLEEYYTPEEAVESILQNNLFGLDIDKRAIQLAQFAVLLKAARYHPAVLRTPPLRRGRGGLFSMPAPRPFSRQEILDFLGKEGFQYEEKLTEALRLMQQAQNLGSIMQFDLPEAAVAYIQHRWNFLTTATDLGFHEQALLPAMEGYIPVLLALCRKYEAVVANPPYMGQKNMNASLKNYVNTSYPKSKQDLFAVFMEVCLDLTVKMGLMSMINQHSWMFLSRYKKLREHLLDRYSICNMIHLGPRTFEELSGEVVQSTAFVLENETLIKHGTYYRLVEYKDVGEKEKFFLNRNNKYVNIPQTNFDKIPGNPIAYWLSDDVFQNFEQESSIGDIMKAAVGLNTGKNDVFLRIWSEVNFKKVTLNCNSIKLAKTIDGKWFPYNKGGTYRKWYGNQIYLINWENDGQEIKNFAVIRNKGKHWSRYIQNLQYMFQEGITWSDITTGSFAGRYTPSGFLFDVKGSSGFVYDKKDLFLALSLLCSKLTTYFMGALNPTTTFQVGDLSKVPFLNELDHVDEIISLTFECVEMSKKDWDARETSWDFQRAPLLNAQPTLEAAFQSWAKQASQDFLQLHANEEALNRIFIDIYGLQDELTPEVPLKDITILQEELDGKDLEALEPAFREKGAEGVELPIKQDVVMQQFISYAVGIFMGRYRLDRPGLHIAHPNPTAEELAPYTYTSPNTPSRGGQAVEIDEDAIIPLMGSACEFPDDAVHRFKGFLDLIWGPDTRTENLNFLQECLDMDLEKYLVKHFWADHCKRYKKKPIYWLFSSPKGAFQVLVYMHRMNKFTVEKIRSNYLLPHLRHLRSKIAHLEAQEPSLSTQEARALDRLRKDLLECEEYDLLLKEMADRQVEFDLDDGVDRNYGLFEGVVGKIK